MYGEIEHPYIRGERNDKREKVRRNYSTTAGNTTGTTNILYGKMRKQKVCKFSTFFPTTKLLLSLFIVVVVVVAPFSLATVSALFNAARGNRALFQWPFRSIYFHCFSLQLIFISIICVRVCVYVCSCVFHVRMFLTCRQKTKG